MLLSLFNGDNCMTDVNKLLDEVIMDAISIGFPVSENLQRKIYIDYKRYDRVGACYRYNFPEKYEIHLSEDTLRAKSNEIKNIIAHEVLHSYFLTMDHNSLWRTYQQLMNAKLGYNIQIKYSWYKIINK
jgi:hypothetical protein